MCFPAGRRSPGSGDHKQKYSITKLETYKVRCYDTDKRQWYIWSSYLALCTLWVYFHFFYPAITYRVTEEGERLNESSALLCSNFSSKTRALNGTTTTNVEDVLVGKGREKKKEITNSSNLPCVPNCVTTLAERMEDSASSAAFFAVSKILPADGKALLFYKEKQNKSSRTLHFM